MKGFVDSLTRWDILFLNSIFRLDGKRIVALVMPCIDYWATPVQMLRSELRAWVYP